MSAAGPAGAEIHAWAQVATGWEDFLLGAIEQRAANAGRRLLHHWRIGDTCGALALLGAEGVPAAETHPAPGVEKIVAALANLQPQTDLDAASDGVADALAQGELPNPCRVFALDESLGERVAANLRARGLAATAVTEAPGDLVIAHEPLNLASDPAKTIEMLEKMAAPGGRIAMTVAGPGVERDRLWKGKERALRWEFDHHDLRELFAGRTPEHHVLGGNAVSAADETPICWHLYRWQPGGPALKWPDMERRAALTIPQQTVSVCMIARNEEAMLHRCLKSVRNVADEIIIADDGSTDSTVEIAGKYGAQVFAGESPLKIGFDEARNATIALARGDWVLWIDSDEELLEVPKLTKYLWRWSMYNGYGLRQHHFSAVPENAFKPDLPVRLFRRVGLDGVPTGIRFFGFVHEHPEIEINQSVGQSVVLSDLHIAHDGYLTENIRRSRFDRNIGLMFRDRQKYPHRLLGKFLMIRDWCHLARYATQRSGGKLTSESAGYLEMVVEAYQKDFLGKTNIFAVDGLPYYNEALQMLGLGFEVKVALSVGAPDGPRNYEYAGRVANSDDMRKMLAVMDDLAAPCTGKYL